MNVEFKNGKIVKGDELAFFKQVFDDVPASIVISKIDNNGNNKTVWMNKHYERATGFSYSDRQLLKYEDIANELHHSSDESIIRNALLSAISNPNLSFSAPIKIKCKNQVSKWFFTSIRQLTIKSESNYMLTVMLDAGDSLNSNDILINRYAKEIKELKRALVIHKLTKTELSIVEQLCKGSTVKDIAQFKKRSPETINNHKRNIFKKLEVKKISELVFFAVENGLI